MPPGDSFLGQHISTLSLNVTVFSDFRVEVSSPTSILWWVQEKSWFQFVHSLCVGVVRLGYWLLLKNKLSSNQFSRIYLSLYSFELGSSKPKMDRSIHLTGGRGEAFTENIWEQSKDFIWLVFLKFHFLIFKCTDSGLGVNLLHRLPCLITLTQHFKRQRWNQKSLYCYSKNLIELY